MLGGTSPSSQDSSNPPPPRGSVEHTAFTLSKCLLMWSTPTWRLSMPSCKNPPKSWNHETLRTIIIEWHLSWYIAFYSNNPTMHTMLLLLRDNKICIFYAQHGPLSDWQSYNFIAAIRSFRFFANRYSGGFWDPNGGNCPLPFTMKIQLLRPIFGKKSAPYPDPNALFFQWFVLNGTKHIN